MLDSLEYGIKNKKQMSNEETLLIKKLLWSIHSL